MLTSSQSRFQLLRKLGEGGMGLVYEAYDRLRKKRVALKKLRDVSANNVFRFKREFRALRDISHPNIITLYELVTEHGDWYLTMELIDGRDFISALRADLDLPAAASSSRGVTEVHTRNQDTSTGPTCPVDAPYVGLGAGLPTPPVVRPDLQLLLDIPQVWSSFRQLARALHVLHAAGMVHRDLKATNVLVTRTGRVVLLDFGIVAHAGRHRRADEEHMAVGTPGFMAPEQACGASPTAATDWYAFGVLLYAVLTGTLPFIGSESLVLESKQHTTPLPPSRFANNIPKRLEELCMALLTRNPADRPGGDWIQAVLGLDASAAPPRTSTAPGRRQRELFVGRTRELAVLRTAADEVEAGGARCLLIDGALGIGKSSLLTRFVAETRQSPRPSLVLSGRCHERETLPYKAFDSMVDRLSCHLASMPESQAARLLPDDLAPLVQVFPVLRRVPACAEIASHEQTGPQLSRRAAAGLRTLIGHLAEICPVVLSIEDLQWADRHSMELLYALLSPPAPARLLVLATMCSDGLDRQSPLASQLHALSSHPLCERISLGPLSPFEQDALSNAIADRSGSISDLHRIAWTETAGHPVLLSQLARHAAYSVPANGQEHLQLEDILIEQACALPRNERILLELIAVAGGPMPMHLLAHVGTLSLAEVERAAALLRIQRLARIARSDDEVWLDIYHEKVRHALSAHLPGRRVRRWRDELHRALRQWRTPRRPECDHGDGSGRPRERHHRAGRASEPPPAARERSHGDGPQLLPGGHGDYDVADADTEDDEPWADPILTTTNVRCVEYAPEAAS